MLALSSKNCGAPAVWPARVCLEHGHDPATGAKSNAKSRRRRVTRKPFASGPGNSASSPVRTTGTNFMITPPWMPAHPDHVMENEELLAKLPAFFRALSGQKPSREDLEKLLKIIRSANQP